MGMGFCIISSFLFLFLREIGGSELLMGLSLVFTVATEIPFFFYAGWALRRFGVHALLVTAMLAYLLRLLAYSYLNHAWLVLPFELLHGLTFGATWAAGIHHTSSLAPRGLEATAQTIFGGLFSGLGGFVGAVFGGWLYERWGPRVMFRVLAVLIGLNTLLFCWTEREVLFASLSRRRGGRWLRWREEDGESSECVDGEEVYEKKEKEEDKDSYLQLEREGEAWRISKEELK